MRMLINSKDEEANAKCLEDSFSQSVARMPKVIRFIAKLLKIALIEPSKFLSRGNSLLTFFLPPVAEATQVLAFFRSHLKNRGLVLMYMSIWPTP